MTDASVRAQYEAFPYPPRDPADEKRRLLTGSPSFLPELNHYLFAGRRDFRQPFRALVAGGGTGDGAIQLAAYLAASGGPHEVVYLDLSDAARRIAEARAAARDLKNVRFLAGSLLDVATLAPGPYDYIDCCGVLHHLDDPTAGLRALAQQLSPDGGMGLMLYGAYGRAGVYPLQMALRQMIPAEASYAEQVAAARKILADLPETNQFLRNSFVTDHKQSDAGLYDLLLHSCDRPFTVPQIGMMLERCGLGVAAWIEPCRYEPANYLKDAALRAQVAAKPALDRAALAERLCGCLKTHIFYAAPKTRLAEAVASPQPDLVPWLNGVPAAALADALEKRGELALQFDTARMVLAAPPDAARFVRLIDGRRTLGQVAEAAGLPWADFAAAFAPTYALLTGINKLFLRV